MGSIIMDDAKIGCSLVGAGSLVTQGKRIPDGVLIMELKIHIGWELTTEEGRNRW